ncbi:MAG: DUF5979 domain-containing protein [Chloroflexota bacterium]
MPSRGSLASSARTNKGLVLFVAALFVFSLALFATAAATPKSVLAAAGDPVVTLEDGIASCQGVLPTPGSENTNKRLVSGSLVPGGTATFEISFPVDADQVGGDFAITDCVFIDGEAALKYTVAFVPNNENFLLTFTLQIPAGTPIGAEYCNYAKTTQSPSASPASNRKAGPACFVVGGNISVLKTNEAGDPLAGAHFHIVCTIPTTEAFLPDTIIDGVSHDSTSGGVITQNVVTDATGRIAIQAPEGTSCVVTETEAPDGYDIATPDHVTLVATAEGVHHTFIDPVEFVPAPAVTIVKSVSDNADGGFGNTLETTIGATVHYRITITNTGNVDLTEVTLDDDLFQTAVDNCDIPATLPAGGDPFVCNYTAEAVAGTTKNTATVDSKETPPEDDDATVVVGTGSLKVVKVIPNVPEGFTGSFGVRISCAGLDPVNDTIEFPDPGFVTVNDIPAGTICGVLETSRSDPPEGFDWAGPLFSGTVTIVADETVTAEVTNLLAAIQEAPTLGVTKTNSAPIIGGVHTAKEGTSVTYTLSYVETGTVTNGVLTDVLPAGLTFVSATSSSDFEFAGFTAATRTLTWNAVGGTTTDKTGTVTYLVTVNKGAAALKQPLVNLATIDSTETTPVTATSNLFVPPPPLAETAPPTDVAGTTDGNVSGGSMLFILLALAGLVLAIAFVAPTPAAIRKRR